MIVSPERGGENGADYNRVPPSIKVLGKPSETF
jgi:hypothetical protein